MNVQLVVNFENWNPTFVSFYQFCKSFPYFLETNPWIQIKVSIAGLFDYGAKP
jgi:hypothetical protein